MVDEQKSDLDVQMQALDDFVARARSENEEHHRQHSESMQNLSGTVEKSFANISNHFTNTFDRVRDLGDEMETDTKNLNGSLAPLQENICRPLHNLRDDINNTTLREYEPTGDTPEKKVYQYPSDLPRTASDQVLRDALRDAPTPSRNSGAPPVIFNDVNSPMSTKSTPENASPHKEASVPPRNPLSMSLREVDPNLTTGQIAFDPAASTMSMPAENATLPLFKRSTSTATATAATTAAAANTTTAATATTTAMKPPPARFAKKQALAAMACEGRENVPPAVLSQGSRRKSPRLR